jgi:hypothetical protein
MAVEEQSAAAPSSAVASTLGGSLRRFVMVGILDPFFEDNPENAGKLLLEAKKPVRRLLDCNRSPTLDVDTILS